MMTRSEELFARAVKVIPGGVNSPVRAYGNVGMTPRFITVNWLREDSQD